MMQERPWSEYCRELPLIACVGLMDEWMTIYACLQNASLVFDKIVVCGESASERALSYLVKFKTDHPDLAHKVEFVELGYYDPWPWLRCPRPGKEYSSIEEIPKGSWAKSMNKRFNWTRAKYPNSLIMSLHSDVIMFKNSRDRIYDRFAAMKNPFLDSEWFCMSYVAGFDKLTAPHILDKNGVKQKDPTLAQRVWYDYPGDWGLCGCYASSLLTVGPDPISSYAECFFPWSSVTQMEKKGHDTNPPYAAHLGWCKDSFANTPHHDPKTFETIESLNYSFVRIQDVSRCYYPNHVYLDDDGIFRYKNSERE